MKGQGQADRVLAFGEYSGARTEHGVRSTMPVTDQCLEKHIATPQGMEVTTKEFTQTRCFGLLGWDSGQSHGCQAFGSQKRVDTRCQK